MTRQTPSHHLTHPGLVAEGQRRSEADKWVKLSPSEQDDAVAPFSPSVHPTCPWAHEPESSALPRLVSLLNICFLYQLTQVFSLVPSLPSSAELSLPSLFPFLSSRRRPETKHHHGTRVTAGRGAPAAADTCPSKTCLEASRAIHPLTI